MKVTVEYAAQVKRAAGVASEIVELPPGATLQQLVQTVVSLRGDQLAGVLLADDGGLHPSILVFVGDEQVRGEAARPLREGDTVSFLSPISGG